MSFNKKKFNIIVAFTIGLICLVVAISAVEVVGTGDVLSSANAQEIVDIETEKEQGNDASVIEKADKMEEVKNFSNGWDCLNYALKTFKDYDSKMTFKQTVISSGYKQLISREAYNIGEFGYTKIVADGSDIPFGLGQSYTQYAYTDYEKSAVSVSKNGGKFSDSIENYTSTYGNVLNEIPYMFANSSQTTITFKNDPTKNYYEIKATLKAPGYAGYLKNVATNAGDGSNPVINSIKLVIRIDKQYGTFQSIVANESYKVIQMGGYQECESSVAMSFNFKNDYSNSSAVTEIKNALGI